MTFMEHEVQTTFQQLLMAEAEVEKIAAQMKK